MAKDSSRETKVAAPETYGAVVEQLEGVVKRLEEGELSLEDSLQEFEQGIRLVRRGEKLLGEAEHRVEQLLKEETGDRAVPLELATPGAPRPSAKRAATDSEDVPF